MKDKDYLLKAVQMANSSRESIPCGCVAVNRYGKIIASEFNSQKEDGLTISHAELKAITKVNKIMGRRLSDVTIYCNNEPCSMCLSALIFAGVERVVFINRLNDLVEDDYQINLDCFEFIKRFPYQPILEQMNIEE